MPIAMATTTPTSPGWQLITAALIGFAVIVLLITRFKLHPFLSLTIGALTVGAIAGMGMEAMLASYSTGVGSTVASACEEAGHEVVILDDLSAGRREFVKDRTFYEGDIADITLLERVFADHPDIDAVIHCAAKIVVPESVAQPLAYYDNNVGKAIALLQVLERFGVRRFVLSSTASMYDPGSATMVDETSPVGPQSPYAASKWLPRPTRRSKMGCAGFALTA